MLVAHADTVLDAAITWERPKPQRLFVDNRNIRNANGVLGADDRTGCAFLWLLKDLGHSLLVTDGEEMGCLGSNWLMDENPAVAMGLNEGHQFMVQFDRRGSSDFKCYSGRIIALPKIP